MELTAAEHESMAARGTTLQTIAEPVDYDRLNVLYPTALPIDEETQEADLSAAGSEELAPLAAGMGRYILHGTCGFLKTTDTGWEHCGAYRKRPAVCRNFAMGGSTCKLMRVMAGVDTPASYVSGLREFLP